MVLVQRAVLHAGDEPFPDPGLLAGKQPVGGLVPAVEVTDHADRIGIRRPDAERGPVRVVREMRAQLVEEMAVRALVEKVQVERTEQRTCDHGRVTTSRMPRNGMRTQSGRMFSSYLSSYSAFSKSIVLSWRSRSSAAWGTNDAVPAAAR